MECLITLYSTHNPLHMQHVINAGDAGDVGDYNLSIHAVSLMPLLGNSRKQKHVGLETRKTQLFFSGLYKIALLTHFFILL